MVRTMSSTARAFLATDSVSVISTSGRTIFKTTPGTPKAIVNKLYNEISTFMRSPETVKTFTAMGGEVDILNTEQVRKFVADEMVKWRKVAIESGMTRDTN